MPYKHILRFGVRYLNSWVKVIPSRARIPEILYSRCTRVYKYRLRGEADRAARERNLQENRVEFVCRIILTRLGPLARLVGQCVAFGGQ